MGNEIKLEMDALPENEGFASALAYSASAVCHFWEKMRACADSK